MKKNIDAKTTMLLHSEAKVEFFKSYLERYLRILCLAQGIDEVNIFDVFCGTGIYDNDKKGSPIVAFEAIKQLREENLFKSINLVVNDSKPEKVSAVKRYIDDKNKNYCNVDYHNKSAENMFEDVIATINGQNRKTRNLIFIDPYGYKEIKKSTLQSLLANSRTEIILFLPISQMQRFTTVAIESDLKPYEPLKEFVYSFFPGNHPIKEKTVTALEYINYVKEALRFSNYFSTSYFIERDEANYYGLFFISPTIYGFEKVLEVKWKLGKGFKRPEPPGLFDAHDKQKEKTDNYSRLETILKEALNTPKTNREIYEIILRNEFLPTHGTEVFSNWQAESSNFEVAEIETGTKARKGSFYIAWEHYNPAKNSKAKVTFILKK